MRNSAARSVPGKRVKIETRRGSAAFRIEFDHRIHPDSVPAPLQTPDLLNSSPLSPVAPLLICVMLQDC
jgi:hypothetical protein